MQKSLEHLIWLVDYCLGNSQIDLILTESGYDWLPKGNPWDGQYANLIDGEGLRAAWHASDEPKAGDLAEWVMENTREWVISAIDAEQESHDLTGERLAFFEVILKNL